MKYLLDTATCITFLKVPSSPVQSRVASHKTADIVVCSVVKVELLHGALRSYHPDRVLAVQDEFLRQFVSLPLDDVAANIADVFVQI